ncbi:MAG TPA: GNAT family N-acetyltransferase [Polyangiaceae bacterium]|nr:GNAT family N-acetyltransferase [Polyangiaceae bacterium]
MNSVPTEAVALEPVTVQSAPILANLFELYVYDFSEHMPLQIQPSGRFERAPGEEWWTRHDHFPFLIRWQGALAGFALVRKGSRVTPAPDVMDVAEFFVLRGLRGKGIGKTAAHALFQAFPGAWEVRVRRTNVAARGFWSRAAETFLNQPVAISPFSVDGVDWDVLRLVSGR